MRIERASVGGGFFLARMGGDMIWYDSEELNENTNLVSKRRYFIRWHVESTALQLV